MPSEVEVFYGGSAILPRVLVSVDGVRETDPYMAPRSLLGGAEPAGRLRRHACGEVFTAEEPEGGGKTCRDLGGEVPDAADDPPPGGAGP